MESLYQKAKIDFKKIKKIIYKVSSLELSNLVEPCHYPEIKKYYYELLYACQLTEKDIKRFTKEYWKGRPESQWLLQNDPLAMFYLFLMYVCIKENDTMAYQSSMLFYMIRNYTNLMFKQIRYCNAPVFKVALERVSKSHLFSREKSISGALYHLSKEMEKRYTKGIEDSNKELISRFMTESRHRISQSVKTFAQIYYKLNEEGVSFKDPYEGDEGNEFQYQQQDNNTRVIDNIVRDITVYKYIDDNAITDAKTLSKISLTLARLLANEITDLRYTDNIKIILEMFFKDVKSMNSICGSRYFLYVRKLMATKQVSANNFKHYIEELLLKMLPEIKYDEKYKQQSRQTQFLVNLFVAYYISMIFRNKLCKKTAKLSKGSKLI